jgi:multidrug efflux pump subunit AcrA (membrane-fusion protein)
VLGVANNLEETMGTIFYINLRMIPRAKAQHRFWMVICLIFSAALLSFGCSLLPLNSGRTAMPAIGAFSKAELSLRMAAEARSDELAPMDLQRAKEKLEQARKAMAAGRDIEARRLAEAADVEAELAQARADAEITRLAADQLRLRGDALRQEMEGAARRGSTTQTPTGQR